MANKKFIVPMSGPLSVGDDSGKIGNLSNLTTTDKTNIVSSINEVNGKFPVAIANGGTGGTTVTEARTNLGVRTAEQLFFNADGSASTIELSSSIENYDMIQIFYFTYREVSGRWLESSTIYTNHAPSVQTSLSAVFATTYNTTQKRIKLYSCDVYLSGDQLTWGYMYTADLTDTTVSVNNTTEDTFKITRVLGYKY